jgi:hypothetical protein
MKRTGIAGVQNFDAGLDTPQIVEKRLEYMTPEWKDAFRYAAKRADELGLEMAIAASPGWSETGGPWVTPAQAMKKAAWSETRITGGKPFMGVLPKPPAVAGPIQNVPRVGLFSDDDKAPIPLPEFYADSAVIAFRIPKDDVPLTQLAPPTSCLPRPPARGLGSATNSPSRRRFAASRSPRPSIGATGFPTARRAGGLWNQATTASTSRRLPRFPARAASFTRFPSRQ